MTKLSAPLTRHRFRSALCAMNSRFALHGGVAATVVVARFVTQVSLTSTLIGCWLAALFPAMAAPSERLWQPVRDEVFLQETGRRVIAPEALETVAVFDRKVFAGSSKGLYRLADGKLTPLADFRLPADSRLSGQRASQLAKCFSVGQRVMSVPISLISFNGVRLSMPSICVRSTPVLLISRGSIR